MAIKASFRSRSGSSLVEMIVALAIFAGLIAIVTSILAIVTTTVGEEERTTHDGNEANEFLYSILLDMKSASEVSVDEDTVTICTDDDAIVYSFDDHLGIIKRNDTVLVKAYQQCERIAVDDQCFILRFSMFEAGGTPSYTLYCGNIPNDEIIQESEKDDDE